MCLNTLWTKERTKEWLKDKPDTLIVYKTVQKESIDGNKQRVYPILFNNNHGPYKKINKLKIGSLFTVNASLKGKYKAGYHLSKTKEGANDWYGITLKCKVKKKDIIVIGRQNKKIVIVAKEFMFIEGDEYFGEII